MLAIIFTFSSKTAAANRPGEYIARVLGSFEGFQLSTQARAKVYISFSNLWQNSYTIKSKFTLSQIIIYIYVCVCVSLIYIYIYFLPIFFTRGGLVENTGEFYQMYIKQTKLLDVPISMSLGIHRLSNSCESVTVI